MQWDRSPAYTVAFSLGAAGLHLKMIVRLKERTLLCSAAPFNFLQKSEMTLPGIQPTPCIMFDKPLSPQDLRL